MHKIMILSIIISLGCFMGCNAHKNLQIDPFIGIEFKEIIYFDATSGDIIWKCSPKEIKQKPFPGLENKAVAGLCYFTSSRDKAFVFFGYNSSKNLLTSTKAVNIAEIHACECCKNLKGEALNAFKQYASSR